MTDGREQQCLIDKRQSKKRTRRRRCCGVPCAGLFPQSESAPSLAFERTLHSSAAQLKPQYLAMGKVEMKTQTYKNTKWKYKKKNKTNPKWISMKTQHLRGGGATRSREGPRGGQCSDRRRSRVWGLERGPWSVPALVQDNVLRCGNNRRGFVFTMIYRRGCPILPTVYTGMMKCPTWYTRSTRIPTPKRNQDVWPQLNRFCPTSEHHWRRHSCSE